MKAIKLLITASLALFVISSSVMAGEGWTTNVEEALVKAKKEKKSVLLEFTGSDWCPPCMMMHKKVFSKKSFVKKASKKFILVTIDFPNKNPELKKANRKYLDKYKVNAFPTVVLLDEEGKEFDRFTASRYPSVKKFLDHINKSLTKKGMN